MLIALTALLVLLPFQAPRPMAAADPTIPAGATAVVSVEGSGVQIYACTNQSGSYGWTFRAPEAKLVDPATQKQVGTHDAGPTWTWNDGSSIAGKVTQTKAAPEAGNVPWLLVKTQPRGTVTGKLSPIVWVRRSNTRGGVAPTAGCDAAHAGAVTRIPYRATYTFYTAALAQKP